MQQLPPNDIPMWAKILVFLLILAVGVIVLNAIITERIDREIEKHYQSPTPVPTPTRVPAYYVAS